jgi:hypothetical protein
LLYEADEEPGVREVSRCVAALDRGRKDLARGLPICTRLVCDMHPALPAHPGGRGKAPGDFGRTAGLARLHSAR